MLSGECTLLVEGEERLLRQWDFFHCPAGTEHIFVGAGDGPCAIFMAGSRAGDWRVRYPVSELAARHGVSVEEETSNPRDGVHRCGFEPSRRARLSYWDGFPGLRCRGGRAAPQRPRSPLRRSRAKSRRPSQGERWSARRRREDRLARLERQVRRGRAVPARRQDVHQRRQHEHDRGERGDAAGGVADDRAEPEAEEADDGEVERRADEHARRRAASVNADVDVVAGEDRLADEERDEHRGEHRART